MSYKIDLDYNEKMSEYHATLKSCSSKRSWRLALIDGPNGWMSPRMHELLLTTAEVASDDCHGGDDGYYNQFIPHSALRHVDGYLHVIGKIAETMRSGNLPTTENVHEKVYGYYESWEYHGRARGYLESGGSVEHAIDGLLRMAQITLDDGELSQKKPVTPFDEDFDLVRIMCLDRDCFNM